MFGKWWTQNTRGLDWVGLAWALAGPFPFPGVARNPSYAKPHFNSFQYIYLFLQLLLLLLLLLHKVSQSNHVSLFRFCWLGFFVFEFIKRRWVVDYITASPFDFFCRLERERCNLWSNFLFWAKNKESFYRLEKEEKMWTNVFKIVCIFNDFFLTVFFSSVIIYYRMLSRGS